ncbi:MAG TPA: ABC transporter permease [Gaiellaceae bacterium]|nr:ABC transporter permease [Gaiellaceae bacterium]
MRRGLVGSALSLATSTVIAATAIAVSIAVIAIAGHSPGAALSAVWDGAFGGRTELGGTLAKMIPLTLVALAWIVAFSARRINIGFEGQLTAGGITAAVVALQAPGLPIGVHLPLAVLAGVAGGAVYAAVPAWLWAQRHVNEIITTLLLNFVIVQILNWLVRGPLQESSHGFAETDPLPGSARWPVALSGSPLTWDVLYIPAGALLVAFVLARTTVGFRLRLTGASEEAARYSGTRTVRVGAAALVASGAIAGLAGSSLVLSSQSGVMTDGFSAGYGFAGIVTALLARNSPLGCIPAALLFAALRQGGGLMEARVGVSSSLVEITQGLVVVFLAGSVLLVARARAGRRRAVQEPASPVPEPS